MPDIYASLAAVMADVDHVAKRDRNEQQRFLFRGVDAVVNAVGPVLRAHRVIVVPSVEHVEYANLPTKTGGTMTSCRIEVTYTFYAEDASSITARVAAEAFDYGDKATPKAMSVAFRTALLQALALPTDEPEPDGQTYRTDTAPAAAPQAAPRRMSRSGNDPITDAQLKLLQAAFHDAGITSTETRHDYAARVVGRALTNSREMTKAEASKVIDALKQDAQETSA